MSKIYLKALSVFIIQTFSFISFSQQDPVFSQFYTSGMYLNPALGGMDPLVSATAMYRSQWSGVNPYNTGLLNVVIPYHNGGEANVHRGGIGLNLYNSDAGQGSVKTTGGSLNAAYNILIGGSIPQKITFGMQVGLVQTQYSNSYLYGSQADLAVQPLGYTSIGIDPNTASTLQQLHPNIGAGMLYYYNAGRDPYAPGISGYVGLAVSDINQPNEGVLGVKSPIPMMFKIHGGFEIHVAKKLNLAPNILYFKHGANTMIMTGAILTYLFTDQDNFIQPTKILFGTSYRTGAVVFQTGFGSKYYNLGFSYDYGIGSLKQYSGQSLSAFEISLKTSFHINGKSKTSSKFHTPLM